MRSLILCILLLNMSTGIAQAVWSSKRVIEDRLVFQDIKQKNKWYYGPGQISLSVDKDSIPFFQLVSLRYTGTHIAQDFGEKRFTNILQFKVEMATLTGQAKSKIVNHLKAFGNVQLQPLSIQHLDATLVSGIGLKNDEKKLVKHITSQEGETEIAGGEFWTERFFNIPLDIHEAQILIDQQKNNRLILSLNYAFYAKVVDAEKNTLSISGNSEKVAEIQSLEINTDTVSRIELISSNVLNLNIDITKYPDAIRKIDLNENAIPASFPGIEIRCLDFLLELRPDLAFKSVEIEGISITNVPVKIKTKFSQKKPDINVKHMSFPYAINMQKPLRYRIREIPYQGEPWEGPWMTKPQAEYLIDVTTKFEELNIERLCVDVEIDNQRLVDAQWTELNVVLKYNFNQRPVLQKISFKNEESQTFKTTCINRDKIKPITFSVEQMNSTSIFKKTPEKVLPIDAYILIQE